MSDLVARSKVWLEADGQPFLGDGRYRLLLAIQRNGSINAAARELGISYRKAWSQLQAMEESAPFPLLVRKVGGRNGGFSHLTPEILQLMKRYEKLRAQLRNETERCFEVCFAEEYPS